MKLVLLLFFIFPKLLIGQYFFDFESDSLGTAVEWFQDSWIQYPAGRWSCSPEQPLSGSLSLHHTFDNPDPGCDFILFTHDPVLADSTFSCSFRVRHGYPPSSSNNWQVAILATFSGEILEGEEKAVEGRPMMGVNGNTSSGPGTAPWIKDGLVLGVNLTGSDDQLALWQWYRSENHEICRTSMNYQEQVGPSASTLFTLHIDQEGEVSVSCSMEPGVEGSLLGTGKLKGRPEGRQLVIRYQYSSSQDRKLWLDDLALTGAFRKDTISPRILSATVISGECVSIIFSEPPHQIQCASFRMQWPGGDWRLPDSCTMEGEEAMIRFEEEIPNREWMQLQLAGICDWDGNCLLDTVISLRRNEAEWGDLVFNEVMADPEPRVRLSDREYVELYNRSEEQFNLTGWQLSVNGRAYLLDTQMVGPGPLFPPGQYRVLTGFNLPNEGGELVLLNEYGKLVHAVNYAIPWNAPSWKQEGGWSLESPDPERICSISSLWEYSGDPQGGTPGNINSQNHTLKDTDAPLLLYTGFRENQAVFSLYFSETLRHHRWIPSHFPIAPGEIVPDRVAPSFPFSYRIDLWLPLGLGEGIEWRISLPLMTDCSGNLCGEAMAAGGFPGTPRLGTILISEVMYAPREGAPEYIELYHPGPGYCDLLDLCIDVSEEPGIIENPVPVFPHSRLVPPGTYLVLTENVEHLMEAYHLEPGGKWVGMDSWKGLENQGGFIALTDRAGQTVDRVPYGDQLHMELIGDPRGVSLERIDYGTPGDDPVNWHSAASVAGYATPGAPNSQQAGMVNQEKILQVDPRVFSPDNDGFEDLLTIMVSPGNHGWVVQLIVTDLEGRTVRILANNDLCGPVSTYRWDGESEGGHMVPEGIYILHARGYHDQTGRVWRKRVSVGVIYR